MAELPGYEFTLCKVADESRSTAKRIVGKDDGSYQKFDYDNVKKWFFAPKAVPGHAAMASLLGKLALRCDVMLVMGAPRPGLDLSRSQLRRAVERPGEPATLVAEPRAWLPLDCDGYAVPAPWGRAEHLKDAARAVRDDALGEEFADVACVVAATSQTGLVGEETARLRLLFLLDRLHPLAELENWAKGARVVGLPVDASVFQAQQPIYTARPLRGCARGPRPGARTPPRLRAARPGRARHPRRHASRGASPGDRQAGQQGRRGLWWRLADAARGDAGWAGQFLRAAQPGARRRRAELGQRRGDRPLLPQADRQAGRSRPPAAVQPALARAIAGAVSEGRQRPGGANRAAPGGDVFGGERTVTEKRYEDMTPDEKRASWARYIKELEEERHKGGGNAEGARHAGSARGNGDDAGDGFADADPDPGEPPERDGAPPRGEASNGGSAYTDYGADPIERENVEPIDLWNQLDPPPLPTGVLPKVNEAHALAQGKLIGTDPAGIAMAALVVCAAAMPEDIKLRPFANNPDWEEPARLWVGLVGDVSAKRRRPSWRRSDRCRRSMPTSAHSIGGRWRRGTRSTRRRRSGSASPSGCTWWSTA